MASGDWAHLSDEQLVRYEDGESLSAETQHVESCAECGARLRDLRAAVDAYAEYRDSIRDPQLPAVPNPWPSLDRLIDSDAPQRRSRLLRWWWVPALAAAVSLVLVFRPAGETSAQASRLLEQAALAPAPETRVIAMRVHGRTLVRPAVLTSDGGTAGDAELARLQRLFEAAHYGWAEPLSPRTFQAWRAAQKKRRESVSLIARAGEPRIYRVRTDVPDGVLRAASLNLRAEDLRPTGGDFEFEGEDPVSMEEAEAPVAPASAPPPPAAREAPVETPLGPADTLHVLAALDDIGADAGEPIDVSEDARHRRVIVRAGGLNPERQQAVAAALAPLPRVTLNLESAAHRGTPSQPASSQIYSSSIPPELRQHFEERFGGPVALQEVTDRVLEASAQALARAHAMQLLAAKFPPETETRLAPEDRLLLRRLRGRHLAELESLGRQIHSALKPILDGPSQPVEENERGQPWQAGAPLLAACARETDQLLNRLLAGSYSQPSGEDMLRGLGAVIERMQRTIRSQARMQ